MTNWKIVSAQYEVANRSLPPDKVPLTHDVTSLLSRSLMPYDWLCTRSGLHFPIAGEIISVTCKTEQTSSTNLNLLLFTQAGALLYFVFAEGTELPLQPSLVLAAPDVVRLQRYTACIALRHQDCMAALGGKNAPARRQSLPQMGLPNPLEMSISAHPPLRSKGQV